jgi:hypothetical protein
MGEAKDWGEPWVINEFGLVAPADGRHVSHEQYHRNTARSVACVNLLAGVPTDRLTPTDPAACMFVAWLRGDEAAALAWADEVQ